MYTESNILQLISKYRTELMGMAIIGVLIGHLLMYSNNQISIVDFFVRIVHTQGFLFLSGFGLYYSLNRNGNIVIFYRKRIRRLFIPYLFMAIPFFILVDIVKNESFFHFITHILTIDFWYEGNVYGMWYVSVSILLYFLCPFFYKCLFYKNTGVIGRGWLVLFCMISFFILLQQVVPSYWEIISFGIGKTTMFPLGMIAGYFSQRGQMIEMKCLSLYFVIMLIVMIGLKIVDKNYYEQARTLMGIPLFCFLLDFLERKRLFSFINMSLRWLGRYSLEIYILHLFVWSGLGLVTEISSTVRILIAIVCTLLFCKPVHEGIENCQKYICRK